MMLMEEVFFSFTFGGEMLSLAAAKAVLTKLQQEPVIARVCAHGERIISELNSIIESHGLSDVFGVCGHPSWTFLMVADARGATSFEIKTLLMQELHQRGILSLGAHNLNFAHSDDDIAALLAAYQEVLPFIGARLDEGSLLQSLRCDPLIPLFKVR
jgi:glutamate-1-semialdehyde 2,1-aminomutase